MTPQGIFFYILLAPLSIKLIEKKIAFYYNSKKTSLDKVRSLPKPRASHGLEV